MFREYLEKLVDNVEGGKAAMIMEFDGIEVESYLKNGLDITTIGIEFSQILAHAKRTAQILEAGELEEMVVKTENLLLAFRVINSDYFVVVALDRDGNFGKARFLLRVEAARLVEEL